MREVLTDQTFATATMTLHGDQIEQHFRQHHQNAPPQQRAPCGCGVDHGDEDALDFPEDSYEDEPDEEEDEDDEDDDERDEDEDEEEDSMDDDEYEEDDEQDVVDGYSHHYDDVNLKRMAYEEEKLKLETVRRVREEERRLKEEFRKKKLSERHKQKQEKGTFAAPFAFCCWAPLRFVLKHCLRCISLYSQFLLYSCISM